MVNKKEICPECKRTLRTKCFVFNKLKKVRICNQCNKRIGNNKFYVPFKKKIDRIGKFSISEVEKKRLWRKYVQQGHSYQIAWRKVYAFINGLKNVRRGVKYSDKQRKRHFAIKAKEKVAQQKEFLGGLKNG